MNALRQTLRRGYVGAFLTAYLFYHAVLAFVAAVEYPLLSIFSHLIHFVGEHAGWSAIVTVHHVSWPTFAVSLFYSLLLAALGPGWARWLFAHARRPARKC